MNQQVENAEENGTIEYIGGDDIMSKPDTPLYKYTEENVKNIVTLDSKFDAERDDFKTAYEKNIERYKELAEEVGVPPELIAVIHYRENSKDYLDGSFNVYLHNGEQLVERIQSLCGKSYLKLIHFVCPMIYYRMFVDFGNILIYPFFQFLFGIDTDALQTLLPHLSKETFNQVQP